jgi:hypothetical protein
MESIGSLDMDLWKECEEKTKLVSIMEGRTKMIQQPQQQSIGSLDMDLWNACEEKTKLVSIMEQQNTKNVNKNIQCIVNLYNVTEFTKKLSKTSVNCAHCLGNIVSMSSRNKFVNDPNFFIKVQINAYSDPLVNDVFITKKLTRLQTDNKIFPEYLQSLVVGNTQGYADNMPLQTLITKAIPNPIFLVNILQQSKYICTRLKLITSLLESYRVIAHPCGLIHNDLHLTNILYSTTQDKLFMIDFGRSYIDIDIDIDNSKDKNDFENAHKTLCITPTPEALTYTDFTIKNCVLGYMYDIASVVISSFFSFSSNEKVKIVNSIPGLHMDFVKVLVPKNLGVVQNPSIITLGALWFACSLLIYKQKDRDTTMGNYFDISQEEIHRNIMYSNGVYRNTFANDNHDKILELFNQALQNPISIQAGGICPDQKTLTPLPWNMEETRQEEKWLFLRSIPTNVCIEAEEALKNKKKSKAGGNKKKVATKHYKLFHDKADDRAYIRKANARWYLADNRGKYRYIDSSKTHIFIRQK